MLVRIFMAILLPFTLISCSHLTDLNCNPRSWYAKGLLDGSHAAPPRIVDKYERACSRQSIVFDRQAYEAGFREGHAEYCTGQNGFDIGLHGVEIDNVCTNDDALAFKDGFSAGRELRRTVLNLDPSKHQSKSVPYAIALARYRYLHVQQLLAINHANPNDYQTQWRRWEPESMLRLTRGRYKQIKRVADVEARVAKCEKAKRSAKENGFNTTLKCRKTHSL